MTKAAVINIAVLHHTLQTIFTNYFPRLTLCWPALNNSWSDVLVNTKDTFLFYP